MTTGIAGKFVCKLGVSIFWVISLSCVLAVQAGAESGDPFLSIANGGFETQLNGWKFVDGSPDKNIFSSDSLAPISGGYSLKINSQMQDGVSSITVSLAMD